MITQKDIVAFIATLYKKRYDVPAPPDLLQKWSQLDNAEIEKNLTALFEHWGYTKQQGTYEINEFLNTRIQTIPTYQEEFIPAPAKKKRIFSIGYALLIILLLGIAYVGYQYTLYTNLNMVYCLTDNVSLRQADGKKVGRMDLFPKQQADIQSYSKLLAATSEPVMIKFPDIANEILVRELFIQHDFWSFLLKKDAARAFAANAYLTESEQEFDLFKSVFKELPKNKRENAQLKFVYRKIIVGCLRISNQLGNYITLPCDGQYSKVYDGIVRIDLADDKYQLIAQLNDGVYYHFIGNARDNTFAKIRSVESNLFGLIDNNALSEDVLFKTESSSTFLYNCDGEAKGYEATLMSDDNKQIKDFKWFYSF